MDSERKYVIAAGAENTEVELEVVSSSRGSLGRRLQELLTPEGIGGVSPQVVQALDSWDESDALWLHRDDGVIIGVFNLDGPAPELVDA